MHPVQDMICSSSASDIVYTNLFTGVSGNYLAGSIQRAGMDPNDLPTADKSKMNFGSSRRGGNTQAKAWKDIWGCGVLRRAVDRRCGVSLISPAYPDAGQGIGVVTDVPPVAELVDRLEDEFVGARKRLVSKL